MKSNRLRVIEKKKGKDQSRCCMCCSSGRCVRCSCALSGRPCTTCIPSRSDRCVNRSRSSSPSFGSLGDINDQAIKKKKLDNSLTVDYSLDNSGNAFTSNRAVMVYGADMLGSDGGAKEDEWFLQLVVTRHQLYDLPGGSIGKEFVGLLADEIELLHNG